MDLENSEPPTWRIMAAFLIAPIIPAALYAALLAGPWGPTYLGALKMVAVFGAYPAAILFGVPAYLVLKRRVKPSFLSLCLVGGAVAATPWLLLAVLSNHDYATINNRVTVQNGHRTWFGWIETFKLVGQCFVLGTVGGAGVWMVAVSKWKPSS